MAITIPTSRYVVKLATPTDVTVDAARAIAAFG